MSTADRYFIHPDLRNQPEAASVVAFFERQHKKERRLMRIKIKERNRITYEILESNVLTLIGDNTCIRDHQHDSLCAKFGDKSYCALMRAKILAELIVGGIEGILSHYRISY